MYKTISLSATEARKQFYQLLDKAAAGLHAVEITSRGKEPVVMVNKSDFDSWLETLDVLSNPTEAKAIRQSLKEVALNQGVDLNDLPA